MRYSTLGSLGFSRSPADSNKVVTGGVKTPLASSACSCVRDGGRVVEPQRLAPLVDLALLVGGRGRGLGRRRLGVGVGVGGGGGGGRGEGGRAAAAAEEVGEEAGEGIAVVRGRGVLEPRGRRAGTRLGEGVGGRAQALAVVLEGGVGRRLGHVVRCLLRRARGFGWILAGVAVAVALLLVVVVVVRQPGPRPRAGDVGAGQLGPSGADDGLDEAGLPPGLLDAPQALPVQEEEAAGAQRHDAVVDDVGVDGAVAELLEGHVGGAGGQDAQERLGLGLRGAVDAPVGVLAQVADEGAPAVAGDGRGAPGEAQVLAGAADEPKVQRELDVQRVLVVQAEEGGGQGDEAMA
ncbi:hypothetical protein VTK73DRAFT_5747 [Phialemonium thermophilum]|uniref:Uncharacterized protein n=1 Tax=Phialemonium thermophilum TaxID=223376 RepID=A0ABR3V1T6_9PEZI